MKFLIVLKVVNYFFFAFKMEKMTSLHKVIPKNITLGAKAADTLRSNNRDPKTIQSMINICNWKFVEESNG